MNEIEKLNNIIKNSKYLVFFGGAGVSTESGIPDFRSKDGLYSKVQEYPAEEILSHTFFMNNTEYFYNYYFNNLVNLNIKPNIIHTKLKELEDRNILKCIITQNIDGLHEAAGSKKIINLHGTIMKNHCIECNKEYSINELDKKGIPHCTCGGIIKPNVVLYEEGLNSYDLEHAIDEISKADTLLVVGTSLNVYPAAGLINYFNGDNLIIINKERLNVRGSSLEINNNAANIFKNINI